MSFKCACGGKCFNKDDFIYDIVYKRMLCLEKKQLEIERLFGKQDTEYKEVSAQMEALLWVLNLM